MKKAEMIRGAHLILLLISLSGYAAQRVIPDSVKVLLARKSVDYNHIDHLNKIAFDFLKSEPKLGREIAIETSSLAKSINYPEGYVRSLNVTGSSFWVVGEYESALDFYQMSAREAGAVKDSIGLSQAFHNMGEVYKKVGDFRRSIDYLNQSLDYDARHKLPRSITLYNLGEANLLLDQDASASDYFDRALSQAVLEKNERTIAYTYLGQALIKYKRKEYFSALAYLSKSEKLWIEQGETRSLIQTHQYYSDIYVALEQYDQAEENILKATTLASQINASDLQIINYKKEAQLYNAKKDYQEAFNSMLAHNQLRDSVYNIKKSEQIARLQTLFETESRDIENNLLKEEQSIKDAQIRSQQLFIIAISIAMVLAGIMAWILYHQQKKISEVNFILNQKNTEIQTQKREIESQARKMKKLNEDLSDLNKSLESRIEIRTDQLHRQNQKLIEYAHANAHQLRAPVVSIMGLLNLIERIQLPDGEQVMIEHLLKCVNDLDQITRDLARALEEEILVPESLNDIAAVYHQDLTN